MSTWNNNESKNAAATPSNVAKNAAVMSGFTKPGQGYNYDSDRTYDEMFDPQTSNPIYYDGIGKLPTYTNQPKN